MIIVNSNNKNPSPFAAIEPPIWCAYTAAFLRERGQLHHIDILDAEAEDLSVDGVRERVGEEEALLVAMGANPSASSTPKMPWVEEYRNKRPLSQVSGLHANAVTTCRRVVALPQSHRLVELRPDWHLIDFSKYRAHNWHCFHDLDSRDNYGVVYSSFGCPFNCYFCNIHTLYKGITFRNPQDVVAEIGYLVSRGIKNLKFCDELFALNEKHVTEICEGIKDYKLNIWAYARADTITPDLLEKMKGAGFNWLAYGFDAADKGNPFKAVEMTNEAGINVMGNFMFGLPGETEADMWETRILATALQCEYINFYVALPYPGSEWYAALKDKPTDWSSFNQYSANICADPEVVKFRDEAYHAYITRPKYLSMMQGKFGDKAVTELEAMTEWRFR